MQVWVVSAQVPPFLQVPGRQVGFEVPVGTTDGNKVVDEVDFDGDPGIDFDVNTEGTLDCKTAVDMVIDSKRNVDLKKDEGVSLDVRVDNAGFDATGDVTLKSELVVVSKEDVSNDQEDDATFEREGVVVEVWADDIDTSVDVGVNLNPNDDTTSVVTDPVDNPLLDAVGFSGECGVCKLTENIVGLDSEGIVDNVVPENKENDGKKGEATVTSKFSHRYEPVINPVK